MSKFVVETRFSQDKYIEAEYFEIADEFVKFRDERDHIVVAIPHKECVFIYQQDAMKDS